MRNVETSILINEEPWLVWETLLKFHEYDNWNPKYKYLDGIASLGSNVNIEVHLDLEFIKQFADGDSAMIFEGEQPKSSKLPYRITKMEENKSLEWEGKLLWGMVMHVVQTYELQLTDDNKTLLVNRERIGGYIGNMMPDKMFYSFFNAVNIAYNVALKTYIEKPKEEL